MWSAAARLLIHLSFQTQRVFFFFLPLSLYLSSIFVMFPLKAFWLLLSIPHKQPISEQIADALTFHACRFHKLVCHSLFGRWDHRAIHASHQWRKAKIISECCCFVFILQAFLLYVQSSRNGIGKKSFVHWWFLEFCIAVLFMKAMGGAQKAGWLDLARTKLMSYS